MEAQVWAALIAGAISFLGAIWSKKSNQATLRHQEERLKAELVMHERAMQLGLETQAAKLQADAQLQEVRLRTELRTEFMAEEAIQQLLRHPEWEQRSFEQIKRRIGGFTDDELRRLLVRAGAVAFWRAGKKEFWGLRERNMASLA